MARNNTAILEEECYRGQLASCCECEMRMKAVTKKTRSNVIVLGPTQSTAVTPTLTLISSSIWGVIINTEQSVLRKSPLTTIFPFMSFFAKCGIHTQKLKNHAKQEFDDTMARNNTAILEEECYRGQLASCCECEMRMKAVTKKTRSNVIVLGPTQSTAVTPTLTLISLVVHRGGVFQ